jgi:hypothetical protein
MRGKNQTFYELKELLAESGRRIDKQLCPICTVTRASLMQFLGSLSFENVNDYETRQKLWASLGFCNRHAWQWYSLKNASGSAIIYKDIAKRLKNAFQEGKFPYASGEGKSGGFFDKIMGGKGGSGSKDGIVPGLHDRRALNLENCPACVEEDGIHKRVLEEFAAGLHEEDFRAAYKNSSGVCLPHLGWLYQRAKPDLQQMLLETEAAKWAETERELDIAIDKFNFKHQVGKQELGDEAAAIRRSLWKAAGMDGM